jgi:hypothetical protein
MTQGKTAIETKFSELMDLIPADKQTHLQSIIEIGREVYNQNDLYVFLLTPRADFGYKTAFDIIIAGNYKSVISALARDYEGICNN